MNNLFDTIAAISTPLGKGGISVIRISGNDALKIALTVFSLSGKADSPSVEPRRAYYGKIRSDGKIIDDGLLTYFKAPDSFTGEDVIEISCHGGILLTRRVLEAVLTAGAVPAQGGEFTKRAFLNGKLSLTEAESIIDSIDAQTDEQIALSISQRLGNLSNKTKDLSERIKKSLSSVYAFADYPDEDMRDMTTAELQSSLKNIKDELTSLSKTYREGHAIIEGIKTVIAGKPNTGKSSLLNRLLGEDRAIVSDIPGTTRDTVEERYNCGGVLLHISDTAGLRSSDDEIEKKGVERTLAKLDDAELVLALFDAQSGIENEDKEILKKISSLPCPVIYIVNKCDIKRDIALDLPDTAILISAKYGEGIDDLKEKIKEMFIDEKISLSEDAVIVNARQNAALLSAINSISNAIAAIENGFSEDVACLDLEQALQSLTGLDGRGVGELVVDDIFSRFCVGK